MVPNRPTAFFGATNHLGISGAPQAVPGLIPSSKAHHAGSRSSCAWLSCPARAGTDGLGIRAISNRGLSIRKTVSQFRWSASRPGCSATVLVETGFSITTDDAAGGMVDIHDRRPVCLSPDDALAWMNPNTTVEKALPLLWTPCPESAFQWWQVTRAMGNCRYQLLDASEPKVHAGRAERT